MRAVLECHHVPEVEYAFSTRPVVGHVADVTADQGAPDRLLLAPTIERRGMIQETRESQPRLVRQTSPQVDVSHKRGVVIPDALMRQPSRLRRNIFLETILHKANMPLHDWVSGIED